MINDENNNDNIQNNMINYSQIIHNDQLIDNLKNVSKDLIN